MNTKPRYIAYMRKSTTGKERQSLSIAQQKAKIKEQFGDIKIVAWLDDEQSAFKPGRPNFQKMLELLDSGQADGIVAWHPDRLSRNEVDAAEITYRMRDGKKELSFCSYYFESSAEGIMMLQHIMSNSQYYSAKLAKDVRRGNEYRRSKGWLTYRAPEGWLNVQDPDDPEHSIQVIDDLRFPLRRKMWDLMLTGDYSVPEVMEIANEEWGYMTRPTKKVPAHPLNRAAVYKMFTNIKYAGRIPVPGEPGESKKASYPSMVTLDEFDRVQQLLGKDGRPRFAFKKTFNYKGVMFCGECGCSVTAEAKIIKLANGTEKHLVYYHCTHKRPCSQKKNVEEQALEEQYRRMLGKYQILPEFEEWALEAIKDMHKEEAGEREQVLRMQENTLADARRRYDRLIDLATTDAIQEDVFKSKSQQLQKEIDELEHKVQITNGNAAQWRETLTDVIDTIAHCREVLEGDDIEAKKEIINSLGSKYVLKDGTVELTPHPWLVPIQNGYSDLERQFNEVRSAPEQIRTAVLQAVRISWRSIGDSNS
jgi:site-specific DNA recombinase